MLPIYFDSTLTAAFPRGSTNITETLNNELNRINIWLTANKIAINPDKTKYINFAYRNSHNINLLKIGHAKIKETESIKFLGIYLDKRLSFACHVQYISGKLAKSTGILNKLKYYLPPQIMKMLYMAFIYPYML